MQQTTTSDATIGGSPNTSLLRDAVQRAGLLTLVRNARAALRREVPNWVRRGCPSPAPNVVKMSVVRSHLERHHMRVFVETGTYLGSMVEFIAKTTGAHCYTIEIVPEIHARAKRILAGVKGIELLLGDSAAKLPEILANLNEPATFWLDGHYSGAFTGKSEVDTPVSAELNHILDHPIKRHVILIDDARDFVGKDSYPHLSELLAQFDNHPHYRASVSADIIRIEPR
jgi:hypothetical protein